MASRLTWPLVVGARGRTREMARERLHARASAIDGSINARRCSRFPVGAKPSPTESPRRAKIFSPMRSINDPVAIDPVEYVRVPSSFDDFEPDRDVVDEDGVPGKPSSPCGSVFWLYSHLIIPSLWFEDNRAGAVPRLGPSRTKSRVGLRHDRTRYSFALREHRRNPFENNSPVHEQAPPSLLCSAHYRRTRGALRGSAT